MEENQALVTELPLPFDEKDLEELKNAKCIVDYRGDGRHVLDRGQVVLVHDNKHLTKKESYRLFSL